MNLHSRHPWAGLAVLALGAVSAAASSHREAPLITTTPKVDATDFYIFNSYEPGREDYVTIVANYVPLQDAYGGPNYFTMDPEAVYEIHIDNSADAVEDLTFQFHFSNTLRNISLPIGPVGNRRTNAVPVLAVGQIKPGDNANLNLDQTYTVDLIKGPRRTGTHTAIVTADGGNATFTKPQDNVGNKTIPDYSAYANQYIYTVNIPGSTKKGRMFVGQRKDPFVVNLGETFDLINISTSPLGPENANKDSLAYKNVTSIILEVPKDALIADANKPVIGAWTTASKVKNLGNVGQEFTQVSRLGMPLVNEVVIGVKDKDTFNASQPKDDLQFVDYVTHPTLPAIIELLYGAAGAKAPTVFPRADLVQVFATGVPGLNQISSSPGVGEMIRLNTSIAAVAPAQQKNMGVIDGDVAGYPNGRRPGDDVVDISLRVVMGKLLPIADAPAGQLAFTDGATVNAQMFLPAFPYINPPLPGSPNDPYITVSLQAATQPNGPYVGVPVTYDAATKSLKAAASGSPAFYKVKSDGALQVGKVKLDEANLAVSVEIKK